MNFLRKYIGDRAFYRTLIVLAVPLVIQEGITNFVSLLDNLMIGGLGTEQMSSVSIINQLFFVFNLTLFGGFSGVSIFGAQFYGIGDFKGMRDTFRFRILFGAVVSALAVFVFACFGDKLTLLFLENDVNDPETVARTLEYGLSYLRIMLIGLVPFMIVRIYTGLLREMGETMLPMIASVAAILTNLVLNFLLIYGMFGFPRMGVKGAALATVIARFVEMGVVLIAVHRKPERFPFIKDAYKSIRVPSALVKKIIVTGAPLMLNEILWSIGSTAVTGNYSIRGLTVVAAMNIATTAWNLFCVIMFAMGTVVSIMVGQQLGAGDIEGAKDTDRKLIFATMIMHICIGLFVIAIAGWIPMLYNTEPAVRETATILLRIEGMVLPIHAFIHIAYFTIRSGGKTWITFLLDCGYTWVVSVVLSYCLCYLTSLPIIMIFFIVQFSDILKVLITIPVLRSGYWAKNLLDTHNA